MGGEGRVVKRRTFKAGVEQEQEQNRTHRKTKCRSQIILLKKTLEVKE